MEYTHTHRDCQALIYERLLPKLRLYHSQVEFLQSEGFEQKFQAVTVESITMSVNDV